MIFTGKNILKIMPVLMSLILTVSCGGNQATEEAKNGIQNTPAADNKAISATNAPGKEKGIEFKELTADEIKTIKPNESGQVMVVMFHNFVDEFKPKKGDNGEYTTTFSEFQKLLETLYQKNYRLISTNEFINNDIKVEAGKKPMLFTFDDGTAGEFNLIEENGKLVVNPKSAVGIMEEFNKKHPDFGLKGVFYLNFGDNMFVGKGTSQERIKYLVDKGFDIGNHTYNHVSLRTLKDAATIQKQLGANQKAMNEIIPGYMLQTFSLPFGEKPPQNLRQYLEKGEYEGVKYENKAIMLVGANPVSAPGTKKLNYMECARVRSSGIKPVNGDLGWWLSKLGEAEQYVSDGNPNIVTVPKANEKLMDESKLKERKLVTY